jgi:hypothetical protein
MKHYTGKVSPEQFTNLKTQISLKEAIILLGTYQRTLSVDELQVAVSIWMFIVALQS